VGSGWERQHAQCLVGSEVSGHWLGRREPHEWPEKSPDLMPCEFFLWGWAKEEVYQAKPRIMEQFGGPDSERYHKRPTRFPAEHCGFHPRSCAEAGGYRRCLHWILSYVYIFQFKKVHVKIISIMFALEIQKLWPFLNAYPLPTHPVEGWQPVIPHSVALLRTNLLLLL
jgi:hypothetical protein